MQSLVYVSNNCIGRDCKAHPFFEQEKEFLLNKFGAFFAISSSGIFRVSQDGIEHRHKVSKVDKLISWFKALNGDFFSEVVHMVRDKKLSPQKVIKLFRFTKRGLMLERFIKKCAEKDSFLYSYWISYDGYAVARQKRKNSGYKTLARAHAFDIQLSRNDANPYLMKRVICKYIDKIAFISDNGYRDFLSYYKKEQGNFCVKYLGSKTELSGFVDREKGGKLIVVTCSSVVAIKRLELMVKALSAWDLCAIKWIHIGDGVLFDELKEKAKKSLEDNPLVEYEFTGRLPNIEVSALLKRKDVNLFVNCSEMEGVPVSIMEAMSVGLPIVAPGVGGIPELVKKGSGFLFEEDCLKESLEKFATLSNEEMKECGACAYRVWQEEFCLEKNDEVLFKEV